MTDDIQRMLAAACESRPTPIPIDDVIRRGRRRTRLRRSGGAAFSMLAVGGVLAAVAAWPPGGSPTGPADQPADRADRSAVAEQPGPATVGDDEVVRRCQPLDRGFVTNSENKAGGGTEPIDDWSVAVTQARATWIRAILVSPDEQRFAYCMSDQRGPGRGDYYREAADLRPPFDVRVGINGSEGPVPDGVARLTFETPDGAVTDATIVDGFYLWYADKTVWGPDPVWATFYNADGKVLKRVNANPTSAVPSCVWAVVGDQILCKSDDGTVEDRMPVRDDKLDCDWEAQRGSQEPDGPPLADGQMMVCRGAAGEVVGVFNNSPDGPGPVMGGALPR